MYRQERENRKLKEMMTYLEKRRKKSGKSVRKREERIIKEAKLRVRVEKTVSARLVLHLSLPTLFTKSFSD